MGQRTSSTYGATTVNRLFDLLGRQFSLAVGAESPATAVWTYDGLGGPRARRLRNGVDAVYGYDALSRLTSITEGSASTGQATYEWELPFDGVPRRFSSQRPGAAPENRVYPIDAAGRLLGEQQGSSATFQLSATDLPMAATEAAWSGMTASATTYVLDGRNNWTSRRHTGLVTNYSRDARDALTAIGSQPVSTDASGAITNDGTATYKYDALGLLAEVRPTTGGGRIYKRDALGRIVTETDIASGAITRFAWDGAQRVITQRPNGGIETTLAAEGLDQPVVTIFPGGARRYYHQDRQGSVYAQTDVRHAGVGQLWINYNAYGEPTLRNASGTVLAASSVSPNFGYHGLPHDFGLGLVDMRARAYRPTLGRFLSPDPIGLAGDANLFAFVNSGPLAWRDPLGLSSRPDNQGGQWPQFHYQDPTVLDHMGDAWMAAGNFATEEIAPRAVGAARIYGGAMLLQWSFGTTIACEGWCLPGTAATGALALDQIFTGTGEFWYGERGHSHLERAMTPYVGEERAAEAEAFILGGLATLPTPTPRQYTPAPDLDVEPMARTESPPKQYIPMNPDGTPVTLAQQRIRGQEIPLPDVRAEGAPHTVFAGRIGTTDGKMYRQTATFPGATWPQANGKDVPWSRVDWTTHGRPGDHPDPHQHVFHYDAKLRTWVSGPPEPVR